MDFLNTSNNHLVTEDQLKAWLGYSQRSRIQRWLVEHGVKHSYGHNGRICVTLSDLSNKNNTHSIEFE